MTNPGRVRIVLAGLFLMCGLAHAQRPTSAQLNCPFPVSPNSPLYNQPNPCAFGYRVPQDRATQVVRENPQCTKYGFALVYCPGPLAGNYGQVQIKPTPAPPPEIHFVVPSTPPPLGVPGGQQAAANRLWQYASGLLDRNRYRDAYPLLMKAANMGDKRAQATLGILYQDGHGVKADDRAAAYWFSAAAAQGHRASQFALGGMYEEGEGGLPKDPAKATELYIKSANQGFDMAQEAIGIQYELGERVPRDRRKAIALLRASGDGQWIADALENPRAPARFADERAFGNYLASLRNAEFAASWAKAQASFGGASSAMHSTLGTILYAQWKGRGGAENPNNGGPPIH